MHDIMRLPSRINLGRVGENAVTEVSIDISKWKEVYPDGTYAIIFQRADGTAYPVSINAIGNAISWTVTTTDLIAGYGKLEVRMYQGEKLAKSAIVVTYVNPSLEAGEVPEEKVPDWVQDIIDAYVQLEPATNERLGLVKVDGTSVTVDEDGTIHAKGGGSGGTFDYNELENLPQINGKELKGDVTLPTFEDIDTEVESYVNEHKEDLRGPIGQEGPQGIPGRDGTDGAPGAKGDSGVYTGTEEPSEDYDVWIDPEGEASLEIPAFTSADEGKVLGIVNGVLAWVVNGTPQK